MSPSSPRETKQREERLRQALIETARAASSEGLCPGSAGNLSARTEDGFLITPTGMPYTEMGPRDLVAMGGDGTPLRRPVSLQAARRPSSEWPFHGAIYHSHPEAGAIVHGHPRFSTALACQELEIPPFHYMVAVAGGKNIRCAPYALFGSEELARAAVAALEDRSACLLAHHGILALGDTPAAALGLAFEVEALAAQYCEVLALGEAKLLSDAQMDEVIRAFATYGQRGEE